MKVLRRIVKGHSYRGKLRILNYNPLNTLQAYLKMNFALPKEELWVRIFYLVSFWFPCNTKKNSEHVFNILFPINRIINTINHKQFYYIFITIIFLTFKTIIYLLIHGGNSNYWEQTIGDSYVSCWDCRCVDVIGIFFMWKTVFREPFD